MNDLFDSMGNGYLFSDIKKSYLFDNKKVMEEWAYELNKGLDPRTISMGSNKKVWWKCLKCDGEWQAAISDRTRKNCTGCPYCAGQKVLRGYNDLATKYPEIIRQWNVEKNGIITPSDVMAGSSKNVWWICKKGHEFEQSIHHRTARGQSCPYCSGQKAWKGLNDFETKYPTIAKEWHPEKNGELMPNAFKPGSTRKVWWLCSKCKNEYIATIRRKVAIKGTSCCPACNNKHINKGAKHARNEIV